MLGMNLIELVPYQAVIVAVEAAGEGDLRPGRQHDFGVAPAPGGKEVAAVDDSGSQSTMVDLRTAARMPVRSGLAGKVFDGLVAEEFHDIAAFDQTHALGGESLQFDRADLGAILVALAALLRLFVVVEFTFDPLVGTLEEIDGRPQEVLEVGFEASCAQGRVERGESDW